MELTKLRIEFDRIIRSYIMTSDMNNYLWNWVKEHSSKISNLVENRVRQGVSQPVLRAETSNVIGLLENCKYKLRLYRADHSGEYIGGMEYTELIQQINDMQEKLSKQSA